MKLIDRFKFWKLKRAAGPRAAFKRALSLKLNKAWQERYGAKVFWYQSTSLRFASAGVASLFLVFSAGVSAYAYTNPEVTEGTLLYPVKQTLEKIEESTKKTPESKTVFYIKQLDRREAEKKVLEKKRKSSVATEEKIKKIELGIETEEPRIATDTLLRNQKLVNKLELNLKKQEEKLEKKLEDKSKINKWPKNVERSLIEKHDDTNNVENADIVKSQDSNDRPHDGKNRAEKEQKKEAIDKLKKIEILKDRLEKVKDAKKERGNR